MSDKTKEAMLALSKLWGLLSRLDQKHPSYFILLDFLHGGRDEDTDMASVAWGLLVDPPCTEPDEADAEDLLDYAKTVWGYLDEIREWRIG